MKRFTICLTLCVLAGCSTPVPIDIAGGSIVTPLSNEKPLDSVRCSRATWSKVESVKISGLPFDLKIGEVFASAFTGTKPDLPSIDLISSKFESRMENLGFTGNYSYAATIEVTLAGGKRTFSASHNFRTSAMKSLAFYIKTPVETVVADLLRQVRQASLEVAKNEKT